MNVVMHVVVPIFFLLGLLFFLSGFYLFREKRLIENLPTSKVRSLAMGLVELKGTIVKDQEFLKSPFSGKECVYYTLRVSVPRGKGSWRNIFSETKSIKFLLEDDTGKILVDSDRAQIDPSFHYEKMVSFNQLPAVVQDAVKKFFPDTASKNMHIFGANTVIRCEESVLSTDAPVFVLGTADKNAVRTVIRKGRNKDFFYITTGDERLIIANLGRRALFSLVGGGALMAATFVFFLIPIIGITPMYLFSFGVFFIIAFGAIGFSLPRKKAKK